MQEDSHLATSQYASNKHAREEDDDAYESRNILPAASSGVRFSENNLEAAHAFVNASKRRKGHTGAVALPADFEPGFGNLSLDNDLLQEDGNDTLSRLPVSQRFRHNNSPPTRTRARSRLSAVPAPHLVEPQQEPPRGRPSDETRRPRDVTPHPYSQEDDLHTHRRRSSSRNRARTSVSRDSSMRLAERYDPSRPHVIFVDTLSDTEDEESYDDARTSAKSSAAPTPFGSPTSSDAEDSIVPPNATKRPIQMNKRLREHLSKQEKVFGLARAPGSAGLDLLQAPTAPGLSNYQERGLVLYRPLSFGVVEEPEAEKVADASVKHSLNNGSDIQLEDISDMPEGLLDASFAVQGEVAQPMDVNDSMEIDD